MPAASFPNCQNQKWFQALPYVPPGAKSPQVYCWSSNISGMGFLGESKNPSKVSGYKSPAQGYLSLAKQWRTLTSYILQAPHFKGGEWTGEIIWWACSQWLPIATWWNGRLFLKLKHRPDVGGSPLFLVKHCNWSAAFFPRIFITLQLNIPRRCSNASGLCLQRAL